MYKKCIILIFAIAAIFMGLYAEAATYSDFVSGDMTLARSGLEPVHNYTPFIQYRQFNLGHANIHDGSGVTNGDVVQLFNVTENTFIEEVGIRVTTAAIVSGTSAEIGDGTDPDGFVGNNNISGLGLINLSTAQSGVSRWAYIGPVSTGTSFFAFSGVSCNATALTRGPNYTIETNHGPFLTSQSGLSPYVGGDTIDMTVYVDKSFAPGTSTGVTPVFEAYIKGFKRVVP